MHRAKGRKLTDRLPLACLCVQMYVAPHEFLGDDSHADIHINLNITLPELPCAVTSVDAQDVMGSHVVDVGGELHKVTWRAGCFLTACVSIG